MSMLLFFISCLSILRPGTCRENEDPPVDPYFTNGIQKVVQDDKVLFEKSFGMASKTYNVPMTQDVHFMIGSNSKLFTAVAIYQLQEKKILNVDDDIANYLTREDFVKFGLPEIKSFCPTFNGSDTCQPITFRQLMSMSSGMIDGFNCAYEPGAWELDYCMGTLATTVYPGSIGDVVETFITWPMSYEPGSAYHYTNENFILLSYMIEKFSGLSFREYMKRNIFDVIGLKSTYFDAWGGQFSMDGKFATEYIEYSNLAGDVEDVEVFATGVCSVELNPGYCSGTGGLIGTGDDLMAWYKALFLVEHSALLSKESIFEIAQPRIFMGMSDDDGMDIYYAQGVVVSVKDAAQLNPSKIWYQGGTLCAHTTIVLNMAATPPVLSMAFRNSVVVNATQTSWQHAQTNIVGTAFDIIGANGWDMYAESKQIGYDLAMYYS